MNANWIPIDYFVLVGWLSKHCQNWTSLIYISLLKICFIRQWFICDGWTWHQKECIHCCGHTAIVVVALNYYQQELQLHHIRRVHFVQYYVCVDFFLMQAGSYTHIQWTAGFSTYSWESQNDLSNWSKWFFYENFQKCR